MRRTRLRRQSAKAAARRGARARCVDDVWTRAESRCECEGCPKCAGEPGNPCGRYLKRASAYFREVGHVDETVPRSLGGDPTDPTNCRLKCHDCHFSGPSGAHRTTRRP